MKKNSLLKLLSLSAIILSVLLFVAGCTKTPPAPTPVAPVITLSGVTTGTLNYGDSTSFSWKVAGKDLSVSLDGKEVSPSGTYSTGRLFADTSYKLSATNAGGEANTTVSYKVGDWTTSVYGKISHRYWIFDSMGYKTQNMDSFRMYTHAETDPAYYTDQYYYLPKGRFVIKNKNTGKTIWNGHWRLLLADSISMDSEISKIKTLSKIKMVLVETGYGPQGKVVLSKTIYKRDN